MKPNKKICILFCERKIVKCCWRIKHKDPCKLYLYHLEQQKQEKEMEEKRKAMSNYEKRREKELLISDAFDRNAYDETDKNISESLYDEQMDVLLE